VDVDTLIGICAIAAPATVALVLVLEGACSSVLSWPPDR
jgi:hypothetical protein